ncbi:phytoene/squalene synthase family protein [Pseudonocardia endophytica]|uniref:Farnesyl-diphosphate farnesyltransferase n=1 Tax=Pseudonocardia endophytica TaxID=401976 RepID=A0A4R1HHX3_PSEEN|nr:squalene/phytoene synthase family protein [Pseudonocardia endophytica]TCK20511.1 farnesyl-diphosphate farnesyltransferase [Pseudonocardia endophytica]
MTRAADVPREAYAACEAITRREARNFSYGIRLLPPDRRAALSAVYALARRIDDIGDDGTLAHADKVTALRAVRTALREPPDPADPVLTAVADACARHPIPLDAFDELVDGVEADVAMDRASGGPTAPARPYRTVDDTIGYCRQVAGSVGRLCLGVFGSRPHPDAAGWADALGIALQQTNILRDIREDLLAGRVYLPADELDAFGVDLVLDRDGRLADPGGGLDELIRSAASRARRWYDDGLRLVPLLDRRSAACAVAMSGIYSRLLDDIAADPSSVYGRRVSLSGRRKVGIAVRALAGRGARR